jgi:hypothetical protein
MARIIRHKRRDKVEMEIKLTKEACFMLYRMFWSPQTLGEDKPYQAKDNLAQAEIVAAMRWMSTKVFKVVNKDKADERFEFSAFSGKVKQRYLDRMLDVAKHYDKSGRLIQNCTSYAEVISGLTGKEDGIEAVDEDEPPKPA